MTLTIFATLLMLFSALAPRAAASSGGGGSGGSGGSNNSTTQLYNPYAVPASLFPTPANLSLSANVEAVASAPFPGQSAAYAVVVATTSSSEDGGTSWLALWEAAYSPQDARSIALNGTCGLGCGQLPLEWSDLSAISTLSGPVSAVELVAVGSMLVVAASSDGSTYLFSDSLPAESWSSFGPVLEGTVTSLAGASGEVAIATITSDAVNTAAIATDGAALDEATVYSASSSEEGPVGAGVWLLPQGAGYSEVVAYSIAGLNQIELSSSSSGSQFSSAIPIGNFSTTLPNSLGVPLGETVPSTSGGIPGQLALASLGSELVLLYTTDEGGQTVPMTQASGNGGATWDGPYLSGAINGSAVDPALTVSPAGLVYAAWTDPDYGLGAIDEAEYLADGMPIEAPQTVGTGVFNGTVPSGAPTLAVDTFQRPLLLWPSSPPNENGSVAYTGAYLSVNATLNLTGVAADLSLGEWDLKESDQGGSALSSLAANVSLYSGEVNTALASGDLCVAQNLTALSLYSILTHVPLSVSSGLGTVCATTLSPDLGSSPLLNASGIDEPNTYLAVYLDWALEAEAVPVSASPLSGLTEFSPYSLEGPATSLPAPVSDSETVDSAKASVTVTPTPYSPSAYDLVVSDDLPSWGEVEGEQSCNLPSSSPKITTSYTTSVGSTWTNVSIDNGTVQSFSGTAAYPSVWVYDLPEDRGFSWSATVYATTTETKEVYDGCTGSATYTTVSPVSYGPRSIPAMTVRGTFATTLSLTYDSNLVTATYEGNDSAARLTARFNATLPATENLTLSNGTGSQVWSSGTPGIETDHEFSGESGVNRTYTLTVASESRAGSSTAPGSPALAYSGYGSTLPEEANTFCGFTLTTATPEVWNGSGGPYASLNASTVNVTWNSSVDALGFFTYYEVGSAINWTVSGIVPTYRGDGTWSYEVEIHGLEPLVAYNGTFGVSWVSGCLVEEDHVVVPGFETGSDPGFATDPTLPSVWEQDQPYDSVTGSGGGLVVGWDTPTNLGPGSHALLGGYVKLSSLLVPFGPRQVNAPSPGSNTVALDPTLGLNEHYTLEVDANYSYTKNVTQNHKTTQVNGTEPAKGTLNGGFTYQLDSSRDGLTDTEKEHGWTIPLAPNATHDGLTSPSCTSPSNATVLEIDAINQACDTDPSARVTADPADYATNGLVSDFLEKEDDLNPNTVDTAGSHMLDTWNLTFDLGAGSPALPNPSLFHYYYENTTYNFSESCQEGPNEGCSFTPPTREPTNLTCINEGVACEKKGWTGDSTPWASEVLWSSSNIKSFEELIQNEGVGWLRAVTGHYGTHRTITVWGKLSWGVDPLTASTSDDGLADGDQPNPLGPVIVEFNFSSWNLFYYPYSGPQVEPNLTVTTGPNGSGTKLYSGYLPPNESYTGYENNGENFWWMGYFDVSVPVPLSSSQYVYWSVRLWANNGSHGGIVPLTDGRDWQATDLVRTDSTDGYTVSLSDYGNQPANILLNVTVAPEPGKANTLLVVPAGNATLSNAPWGLRKYTGETDFDLFILNLTGTSSPLTVWGIADTGGNSSYSVTLNPGLNNLLVPRGIFLGSPLDQALLNGTDENVTFPARSGLTFDGSYWTNRTQLNSSNLSQIRVFSNSSSQVENESGSTAFGGVPGLPSIEAGVQSREVQAIFWVNISTASELSNLLGGLLMNGTWPPANSSGAESDSGLSWNLTNSVDDVTNFVGTLGLPSAILEVLANSTLPNNGSYGPPHYQAPPPQPSIWSQFKALVWDTITGIAAEVVGGAETFGSVVWSSSIAAGDYIGGAIDGTQTLLTLGLSIEVSSLELVQRAMVWAANALLNATVQYGVNELSPDWQKLNAGIESEYPLDLDATNALLSAVANASLNPTTQNTSAAQSAATNFDLMLTGDPTVAKDIQGGIDALVTALQPIETVIDGNIVVERIMTVLDGALNSPTQADLTLAVERSSLMTKVDQGYGWFLGGLMQDFGLGLSLPSTGIPSAAMSLLEYPSKSGSFLDLSQLPSWLANPFQQLWTNLHQPFTGIDLVLAIDAVIAWALQSSLSGAAVEIAGAQGVAVAGIMLTALGFVLFSYGGAEEDWLSIATDGVSIGLDLYSYAATKAALSSTPDLSADAISDSLEWEALADGVDIVADTFDIGLCSYGVTQS